MIILAWTGRLDDITTLTTLFSYWREYDDGMSCLGIETVFNLAFQERWTDLVDFIFGGLMFNCIASRRHCQPFLSEEKWRGSFSMFKHFWKNRVILSLTHEAGWREVCDV